MNLGFPYERVLTVDSQSERAAAMTKMNNINSRAQFLLAAFNVGVTGLNLQKACHIDVHFQPLMIPNQTAQAMGRVNRLGQPEEQQIYLLSTMHTISRRLEEISAVKTCPQLTAFYADDLAAEEPDALPEPIDSAWIARGTVEMVRDSLALYEGDRVRVLMKDIHDLGGKPAVRARNRITRQDKGFKEDLEEGQEVQEVEQAKQASREEGNRKGKIDQIDTGEEEPTDGEEQQVEEAPRWVVPVSVSRAAGTKRGRHPSSDEFGQ